jgi:hypothetical protein
MQRKLAIKNADRDESEYGAYNFEIKIQHQKIR